MPHLLTRTFGDVSGPMIVVHGGAGARSRDLSQDDERSAHDALRRAIEAGNSALATGASALVAVVAAVRELEDAPDFNAGRGAALTAAGTPELDACVMDGRGRAGAVTGVVNVKNPVEAALAVLERTPHVLLAAPSSELVEQWELERVDASYFVTPRRVEELEAYRSRPLPELQHGTVGAVARDADGRVAAATSTGGVVNQMVGRIGDTPLVGAGTFADDASVAISCTGAGEAFIAEVAAFRIHSLMAMAGKGHAAACAETLERVAGRGGTGGVISVAARGQGHIAYNSGAMFYGYAAGDELETHV